MFQDTDTVWQPDDEGGWVQVGTSSTGVRFFPKRIEQADLDLADSIQQKLSEVNTTIRACLVPDYNNLMTWVQVEAGYRALHDGRARLSASWTLWGYVPSAFTDVRPRQWCTGLHWSMTAVCGLKPKPDHLVRIVERQVADSYRRMLGQFSSAD